MIVGQGLYHDGLAVNSQGTFDELAARCHADGPENTTFAWVGLADPSNTELSDIQAAFHIHPLAIEDAGGGDERPKVDLFGDTLTVVLRPARFDTENHHLEFGQITIMCSPTYVIVVRRGDVQPLSRLRRNLESKPELLKLGPGAVMHQILDTVVEGYYPTLEHLYDDISSLEERIFSNTTGPDPTEDIYRLQAVVLRLTKAVAPLNDVLKNLRRNDHPVLTDDLQHYVADTDDDVQRIMDTLGSDRDVLLSALEANLTKVSIRQNEDMRKMSAWAAIIAVPTAIAGIYGMNFRHMPELDYEYSYFIVLGGIALICVMLWRSFKRSGWL